MLAALIGSRWETLAIVAGVVFLVGAAAVYVESERDQRERSVRAEIAQNSARLERDVAERADEIERDVGLDDSLDAIDSGLFALGGRTIRIPFSHPESAESDAGGSSKAPAAQEGDADGRLPSDGEQVGSGLSGGAGPPGADEAAAERQFEQALKHARKPGLTRGEAFGLALLIAGSCAGIGFLLAYCCLRSRRGNA